MNQQDFIASREAAWQRLEALLDGRDGPQAELPALYRQACHDLALARERRYGHGLIVRLEDLVLRGHQTLYRSRHDPWPAIARWLAGGLARAVRREWRFVAVSAALFYLPALFAIGLVLWQPQLVTSLLDVEIIRQMEAMYDPSRPDAVGRDPERRADSGLMMLGYYIRNNTGIGFRTFAGGIAFGLGTLFFLLYNALMLGAVAGHLSAIGFGETFWPFVLGHGALELNAIVLSGAAGLMLGHALIAPGRLRRLDALRLRARAALEILWGAALMFLLAAFIEAFWSPLAGISVTLKYAVAGLLWSLVIAYFLFAGRRHGA